MKKGRKLLVLMMVISGTFIFNRCNKNEVESEILVNKTELSDYLSVINGFSLATKEEITSCENDGIKSADLFIPFFRGSQG